MPENRPANSAKALEAPARILAVDDDETVLYTYRRLLTKAGYQHQVQTASSGEEALRLLKKHSYDLILLDLNMPGMDGMEFMRRLRGQKHRPEVLVISGYVTIENTVKIVKLGAFDVAQKPCLSGDLLPRIERILARRREPVNAYIQANFAKIKSREEVARQLGYVQNTCKKLSLQFGMVVSGTTLGCKGWGLPSISSTY
ncbi:MAG: response regulator [Candidatus Latescibacteria bacterium]|nr:response regulator [Candidatus Latescibacterota bacterium]